MSAAKHPIREELTDLEWQLIQALREGKIQQVLRDIATIIEVDETGEDSDEYMRESIRQGLTEAFNGDYLTEEEFRAAISDE